MFYKYTVIYLPDSGSIFRERRGPASDTVDDVPMDEDAGQQTPHNASDSLSELGTLLLCTEVSSLKIQDGEPMLV